MNVVHAFPSARDFETWVRYGRRRGEKVVYYTGNLMADRQRSETINALARAAWRAYEQGRVILTQQRQGDTCQYIATSLTG